ncbi:MAG TPA: nicotinate (nicotinamide) nucleotide adenylyltransferase [Solirubrobacteraceae bacterium]|nr:nicotinate (nicotinamide) nucleotide adenylyltransferase [Solirubrobacteraceae bacterium]
MRTLGILGGTFNPPHLGHLALARQAREELGLEHVLVMPVHTSPHKTPGADPGAEHRLRMCALAVAEVRGVESCGLEVERGGASYTVDTLQAIHAICPDARLTFIVGADTARTLDSWREPARLLELAELAVAMRAGTEREQVLATVASIAAGDEREAVRFLGMEPMEVSSSLVRERAARSEPIEGLVGEAVADYIAEHGLYRAPVEVAG